MEDYTHMVLRNAKMLSGVELTVRGDTPKEKTASFLEALIKNGLAEVQDDEHARIPSSPWFGRASTRFGSRG